MPPQGGLWGRKSHDQIMWFRSLSWCCRSRNPPLVDHVRHSTDPELGYLVEPPILEWPSPTALLIRRDVGQVCESVRASKRREQHGGFERPTPLPDRFCFSFMASMISLLNRQAPGRPTLNSLRISRGRVRICTMTPQGCSEARRFQTY